MPTQRRADRSTCRWCARSLVADVCLAGIDVSSLLFYHRLSPCREVADFLRAERNRKTCSRYVVWLPARLLGDGDPRTDGLQEDVLANRESEHSGALCRTHV